MTRHRREIVGVVLAVAVVAQGLILVRMDGLAGGAAVQLLVVVVGLASVVAVAWRVRLNLNHRVDMLLVMLAAGGLGMVVGMLVDQEVQRASAHAMHEMSGHHQHHPGSPWDSILTWMTALMLAAAIPASLAWTRCAELARSGWRRWVSTHLIGNAAMVIAMVWFGHWFGEELGRLTGAPMTGHHIAMVIGMLVGMEGGMFLGEAILGLKPWQEWRWENENRSQKLKVES